MTGIEVWLAYQNMELVRMLSILMGLSLIKAALIIGYFMHLKFEDLGHEVGYHEFAGILSGHDAGLFARRIPDSAPGSRNRGSEMKLRLCTLAVFLLLWAAPAFSQGCAMCYSSAKGTNQRRPERHQPRRAGIAASASGLHDPGRRHGSPLQQEARQRKPVTTPNHVGTGQSERSVQAEQSSAIFVPVSLSS